MSAKETTPLTAASGAWSSGLCSCFSDCTSCLTVCCLKPVALGQLSQKVLGYPCLFVTILLFSLCMLEDIFGVFEQAPVSTISQYVPVDNQMAILYRCYPRSESNRQSSDPESDALSIRPRGQGYPGNGSTSGTSSIGIALCRLRPASDDASRSCSARLNSLSRLS